MDMFLTCPLESRIGAFGQQEEALLCLLYLTEQYEKVKNAKLNKKRTKNGK